MKSSDDLRIALAKRLYDLWQTKYPDISEARAALVADTIDSMIERAIWEAERSEALRGAAETKECPECSGAGIVRDVETNMGGSCPACLGIGKLTLAEYGDTEFTCRSCAGTGRVAVKTEAPQFEVRCTECGARARHWETKDWEDVKKDIDL